MIAVVLVGGEGTRLRPLTLDRPKPMLPIAGKPFLQHMLDRLARGGVTRVIFSCGYLPDAIVEHFGDGLPGGPAIEYAIEPEPLGTAGAIRFAAAGRVDGPFLALNGDVLTSADITAQRAFHGARGARATLFLTPVEDPTRYGLVLQAEDDSVTAFVEKPAADDPAIAGLESFWINAGGYVLDPDVLDLIPDGRKVSIEHEVFPQLVGQGLYAWRDAGYWNDIGTPSSYLAANRDVLAGALGSEPVDLLDAGTVAAGAVVGGGTVVGEGAHVAAGARVTGSVLHEGATVEAGAVVEDSVLGRRARVGADARVVAASIVGAGVEVPAGAVVDGEKLFPDP